MPDSERLDAKARGGLARAAKLSPEKRSEIAAGAARRRWADRPEATDLPRALPEYQGVLNLGGMSLPCAVIQGPAGIQRVITETGITNAILGSRSGASKRLKQRTVSEGGAPLPIFLAPGQLKPFISRELEEGPLTPIIMWMATGSCEPMTHPFCPPCVTSG